MSRSTSSSASTSADFRAAFFCSRPRWCLRTTTFGTLQHSAILHHHRGILCCCARDILVPCALSLTVCVPARRCSQLRTSRVQEGGRNAPASCARHPPHQKSAHTQDVTVTAHGTCRRRRSLADSLSSQLMHALSPPEAWRPARRRCTHKSRRTPIVAPAAGSGLPALGFGLWAPGFRGGRGTTDVCERYVCVRASVYVFRSEAHAHRVLTHRPFGNLTL